jgi:hypothetical protein
VYSPAGDEEYDHLPVTVEDTRDMLLHAPYQLLAHNAVLLAPLFPPKRRNVHSRTHRDLACAAVHGIRTQFLLTQLR